MQHYLKTDHSCTGYREPAYNITRGSVNKGSLGELMIVGSSCSSVGETVEHFLRIGLH